MKDRILIYRADCADTADAILKREGVSSGVRKQLRKTLGTVCAVAADGSVRPIRMVDCLQRGELLQIRLRDESPSSVPAYPHPIPIVYEDDDLAVIDKPAGIAVIPVHGHYGRSLANALAAIWGERFVYRPVNRLDRDTSGLMIVAKHRLAHAALSQGDIKKKYLALCEGLLPEEGVVDAPIALLCEDGMKRCVREDGKPARTLYRRLDYCAGGYSKAEVTLCTGRTHQIRVHMAYIGHPLCCDALYHPHCEPIVLPDQTTLARQALHSSYLQFVHPVTGKIMEFRSECF